MAGNSDAFIARWTHADGTERASYQLLLSGLAERST